jgi:ABC-2 type transport system permease protein
MNRALKVAQREYLDTIRTKAFIFGVVFAPLMIAAIALFALKMSQTKDEPRADVTAVIVDMSGAMTRQIDEAFARYNQKNPKRKIAARLEQPRGDMAAFDTNMKEELRGKKLDIYVVMDPNIVEGTGRAGIYTHKLKAVNADAVWTVRDILNSIIVNERCRLRNISPKELAALRNVDFDEIEVGRVATEEKKGLEGQVVSMMVPFFFMYLMFMGVMAIGPHMISGLIEEKNSRIIEVLLSAVSPQELMLGKIAGLGAVGLTVMALWGTVAYTAASWKELPVYIPPALMVWFVVYYVLGFLLFGALMAGVGSVCNTVKETQSLLMPITFTMVIPMIAWPNFTQSPNGVLATVLSFVPPMTPLVMIVRMASGSEISSVQQAGAVALLAVSVAAAIWAAGKVFRTGVLMYGKRPGFAEIFRLIPQK